MFRNIIKNIEKGVEMKSEAQLKGEQFAKALHDKHTPKDVLEGFISAKNYLSKLYENDSTAFEEL
jgi:hypothetical protein